MALRGKVVDFVRLYLLHEANEVGRVRQVTIVEMKPLVLDMRILIDVLDPSRVKRGRTPLHAMDDIALFQQESRKIGSVLSGDASYQCNLALSAMHGTIT